PSLVCALCLHDALPICSLRPWSRWWRGWTEVCLLRLVFRGGPVELEQMDSADSPLAFDSLYGDRRQGYRKPAVNLPNPFAPVQQDRKSTRLNSSHVSIS